MESSRAKTEAKDKGPALLRKGYTTGACAAAAAKAAAYALIKEARVDEVKITLPGGQKAVFGLHSLEFTEDFARASVIKDAGDDPDVTNGAEIAATVRFYTKAFGVFVKGGKGVGRVTKPGLAVPVGHAAINPMPLKMIKDELGRVMKETGCPLGLEATIIVPKGEEISKKTLNERLGIVGGISILGTTGIVNPISAKAWTDTVEAAMDVARACGVTHAVLTPGRTSETAAMKLFAGMPVESFIQMGDHVGFSLNEARRKGFEKVTVVGQFGKLVKMAMGHTDTHATNSTLELEFLAELVYDLGLPKREVEAAKRANTAREVFLAMVKGSHSEVFAEVCRRVGAMASNILGSKVGFECIMVDYEGKPV